MLYSPYPLIAGLRLVNIRKNIISCYAFKSDCSGQGNFMFSSIAYSQLEFITGVVFLCILGKCMSHGLALASVV